MSEIKLKKKYGLFTAISMAVGIVMGSGIFFKAQKILEVSEGSLPVSIFAWLIGGLIMLVLALVSWLPAGVLAYAGHESMMGVLGGDATDLPASVPFLVVFFFMLASVVTSVFGWLTLFPLAYLYGSVETRKKDLAAFEAEERRLQEM